MLIILVLGMLIAGIIGWMWRVGSAGNYGPISTPSCKWPVRITGPATTEQDGLIRCYLKGLATGSLNELKAVADDDPPVRITQADLSHSADATSGTATAQVIPNQVDSASFLVSITFADGTEEQVPMQEVNPMAIDSWRLVIGTYIRQDGPTLQPPVQP